jgi:hypothetical protein
VQSRVIGGYYLRDGFSLLTLLQVI